MGWPNQSRARNNIWPHIWWTRVTLNSTILHEMNAISCNLFRSEFRINDRTWYTKYPIPLKCTLFFLQIYNDFTTGEYGPTVYIVIIVILAAVIAAMAVVMIRWDDKRVSSILIIAESHYENKYGMGSLTPVNKITLIHLCLWIGTHPILLVLYNKTAMRMRRITIRHIGYIL